MRRNAISLSALPAIAAMGVAQSVPAVALLPKTAGNHRRAARGPTGAIGIRRAAVKARNVQRNRKAHRG